MIGMLSPMVLFVYSSLFLSVCSAETNKELVHQKVLIGQTVFGIYYATSALNASKGDSQKCPLQLVLHDKCIFNKKNYFWEGLTVL